MKLNIVLIIFFLSLRKKLVLTISVFSISICHYSQGYANETYLLSFSSVTEEKKLVHIAENGNFIELLGKIKIYLLKKKSQAQLPVSLSQTAANYIQSGFLGGIIFSQIRLVFSTFSILFYKITVLILKLKHSYSNIFNWLLENTAYSNNKKNYEQFIYMQNFSDSALFVSFFLIFSQLYNYRFLLS